MIGKMKLLASKMQHVDQIVHLKTACKSFELDNNCLALNNDSLNEIIDRLETGMSIKFDFVDKSLARLPGRMSNLGSDERRSSGSWSDLSPFDDSLQGLLRMFDAM